MYVCNVYVCMYVCMCMYMYMYMYHYTFIHTHTYHLSASCERQRGRLASYLAFWAAELQGVGIAGVLLGLWRLWWSESLNQSVYLYDQVRHRYINTESASYVHTIYIHIGVCVCVRMCVYIYMYVCVV